MYNLPPLFMACSWILMLCVFFGAAILQFHGDTICLLDLQWYMIIKMEHTQLKCITSWHFLRVPHSWFPYLCATSIRLADQKWTGWEHNDSDACPNIKMERDSTSINRNWRYSNLEDTIGYQPLIWWKMMGPATLVDGAQGHVPSIKTDGSCHGLRSWPSLKTSALLSLFASNVFEPQEAPWRRNAIQWT